MKKIALITTALLFMFFSMFSYSHDARAAASSSSIDVSIVMNVGESVQLAAGYPNVSWTVTELNGSATDKAVITSEGRVTAKKPGKVKVTATASDGTNMQGEILITILGDEVSPSAVLFGADTAQAGASFDLTYGLRDIPDQSVFGQDITITYDPAMLEFVEAVSLKEGVSVVDTSKDSGKVRILIATLGEGNANAANGDLVKLSWKAKSIGQSATAVVTLSKVIVSDANGVETALNTAEHSVQIQVSSVNKQALLDLIADAQAKHDAAVEGTQTGQYPAGSKATLQAAIDKAQAVADSSSSTQQQVDDAVTELSAALQAFTNSVIPRKPGDQNGDDKVSVGDIAIMASAYGKTDDDLDWAQYKNYDINNDGIIDVVDLAAVASIILGE